MVNANSPRQSQPVPEVSAARTRRKKLNFILNFSCFCFADHGWLVSAFAENEA